MFTERDKISKCDMTAVDEVLLKSSIQSLCDFEVALFSEHSEQLSISACDSTLTAEQSCQLIEPNTKH